MPGGEKPDRFKNEAERLSEQFKHLLENKQVLDWWQKQLEEIRIGYKGVSHLLNKSIAESVTTRQCLLEEIQSLKETCERLSIERDEANAVIGRLQTDLVAVSERLDRIADWINKQRGVEK